MKPIFVITLSDVIGLSLLGLFLICAIAVGVATWIRRLVCKHARVYESRSASAMCSDCGKDLGFIGAWRESHGDNQ